MLLLLLESKQMMTSVTQSISSILSPNKSAVLRIDPEAANDPEKQFKIETASVSSSSLADVCSDFKIPVVTGCELCVVTGP